MKIVGKFKKLNPILPLYIVVGLLCATIPVRTYQLLFITEASTGFYTATDWSVYVAYALSALAILVSIIVVGLAKNVPSSRDEIRKKNVFLAVSSILFALGIIVDSVLAFTSILAGTTGTENFSSVVIEAVFGVFAAIYIMIFGISHFDGRTTYFQYRFLALAPLAWTTGRIIIRFMKKISYVNVADLMLEIFILAAMMIFFLAFARISSGLSNEKSMRSLFASGYVCVFFCALANIPRIVLSVTGNSASIPYEYPLSICDLTFALFVVAYIINAMSKATTNDHDEIYMEEEVK
jgi:hypothetical protein